MISSFLQLCTHILLVEDDPGDVRLTEEAFKQHGFQGTLHVAKDGVEALRFVRQSGGFADAPRPDLILLDLNLPGKNGHEVLAEIKADPSLRRIPVVILTTSSGRDDISQAYDLSANCYVTKPVEWKAFMEVIRRIESFWLDTAVLPKD